MGIVSRRYLRVKVLQALYASTQSEDGDTEHLEKEMFKNIYRLHDLYLLMLLLPVELRNSANDLLEARKTKVRPTPEDLSPNRNFVDNKAIIKFLHNAQLNKEWARRKLNWDLYSDNIRKLFRKLETAPEYLRYMSVPENSFKADRAFLMWLYENLIVDNDGFEQILEDDSIYWSIDLELVHISVMKTIMRLKEHQTPLEVVIPAIFPDSKNDILYTRTLLRNTIQQGAAYEKEISSRAENWDAERLAVLDILLMKMALTEFELCPTIPVKVTLNEYIDLAKKFSTNKSRGFVNGILDKVVVDWRRQGRIIKEGRGLLEE